MYVFESDEYLDHLTEQEKEARDIMVNLFNPVLKFVLYNSNEEEFIKYGCNTCRQTAILGGEYLKKLLPDYDIKVYEGKFIDEYPTEQEYLHAFILAKKDTRRLLIDLSRTTKRLIFHNRSDMPLVSLYPSVEEYKFTKLIEYNEINLDEMINTNVCEYFTGMKPMDLMDLLSTLIEDLKSKEKYEQRSYRNMIYSSFTNLVV